MLKVRWRLGLSPTSWTWDIYLHFFEFFYKKDVSLLSWLTFWGVDVMESLWISKRSIAVCLGEVYTLIFLCSSLGSLRDMRKFPGKFCLPHQAKGPYSLDPLWPLSKHVLLTCPPRACTTLSRSCFWYLGPWNSLSTWPYVHFQDLCAPLLQVCLQKADWATGAQISRPGDRQ